MTPARIRRLSLTLLTALSMLAAVTVHAQLAAWDQERVTAAAHDFSQSAGKVYSELYRNQVTYTIGSGQSKDYQRLRDKVRVIRSEARRLTRQLEKGKGRDATLPIYERMMVDVRDAREIARRLNLGEALLNKIGAAGDALRRLGPYYDPKANQNPEAPASE
ncbi:MAG: hypothetical protein ACQGVK_19950 [Myxococcota bacterium]